MLAGLIAADNLSWRVGGWIAAHASSRVTGDMRRDLFRHLTGHSPTYFADRLPGTLAGRITATRTRSSRWRTRSPGTCCRPARACVLDRAARPVDVDGGGAGGDRGVLWPACLSWLAAARHGRCTATIASKRRRGGRRTRGHHQQHAAGARLRRHAARARALRGPHRERDGSARGASLRYLEKLRLIHAAITALLDARPARLGDHAVAAAARRRAGDVVLICSLGFTILHGTRDLAVALVDIDAAHRAPGGGALDAAAAARHARRAECRGARAAARAGRVRPCRLCLSRRRAGASTTSTSDRARHSASVWSGARAPANRPLLALLQRFYDVQGGDPDRRPGHRAA